MINDNEIVRVKEQAVIKALKDRLAKFESSSDVIEPDNKETVPANAKTLKLHLKVCDRFTATLVSERGKVLKDHDCYVPDFMPGEHYGDYVILDIDINTGQITNWQAPSREQIEQFIGDGSEG